MNGSAAWRGPGQAGSAVYRLNFVQQPKFRQRGAFEADRVERKLVLEAFPSCSRPGKSVQGLLSANF